MQSETVHEALRRLSANPDIINTKSRKQLRETLDMLDRANPRNLDAFIHLAEVFAEEGYEIAVQNMLKMRTPYIKDVQDAVLRGAATGGHINIVRMVLPTMDSVGVAPMHAAHRGYYDIVALLLPKTSDSYKRDTIKIAERAGRQDIANLIRDQMEGTPEAVENRRNNDFITAAQKGDLQTVMRLIPLITNVNVLGNGLREAAYRGYKDIVMALLDTNYKEDFIGDSLRAAAGAGQLGIVELLAPIVSELSSSREWLVKSLKTAAYNAHPDVVVYLLGFVQDQEDREEAIEAAMNSSHQDRFHIVYLIQNAE